MAGMLTPPSEPWSCYSPWQRGSSLCSEGPIFRRSYVPSFSGKARNIGSSEHRTFNARTAPLFRIVKPKIKRKRFFFIFLPSEILMMVIFAGLVYLTIQYHCHSNDKETCKCRLQLIKLLMIRKVSKTTEDVAL